MVMHEVSTSETEMHDVQLLKNDSGLGITVAGYVCDEEEISGIFVRDISTGSAADLTGNIKINDRIVKVNGRSVTTLTNQEAIELLKNSGPVVIISVERYLRGSKYDRLQHGVRSNTLQSSISPKYFMSTLPKESVSPIQKERIHLNLLAETTEEEEKFINVGGFSPVKKKGIDDHSSDDSSVAEFKIETDFVKNTVTETPLNSSNSTLINESDLNVHKESAIDQNSKSSFIDITPTVSDPNPSQQNGKGNTSNKINMIEREVEKPSQLVIKGDNSINSDSSCIFFSKSSDDTERDGYETCVDESFSEDVLGKIQIPTTSCDDMQPGTIRTINNNNVSEFTIPRTLTSTHGEHFHCVFLDTSVSATSSEPCLNSKNKNYLQPDVRLNWKSNENNNLKSYDSPSDITEADEFFLVQCIDENISVNELNKCVSEPNVPESYEVQTTVTYKCLKLEEYYNDYEDCLEEYRTMGKILDEEISRTNLTEYENSTDADTYTLEDDSNKAFQQTTLPFKSSSVPHILDYFNEVEPCPTPRENRTFSIPLDYENVWNSEDTTMTVASQQQHNLERKASEGILAKHWGFTKTIEVYRQTDEGLGITIVCGKVDLHTLEETSLGSTSGIFVKSIVPNSAAGKTELFHPGDRILKVDGVDLTDAGQEEALTAIRSAGDPISFVVQSLLPLNDLCIYPEIPPVNTLSETEDQAPADSALNEKVVSPIKQLEPLGASEDEQKVKKEEDEPKEKSEDDEQKEKKEDEDEQKEKMVDDDNQKEKKEEEDEEDEEDDEEDEEEDTRLLGGRIMTKQGIEIDRSSAGNIKRSKEEIAADTEKENEYGYTTDKIRKRYAQLGSTIMMVQLERGQEGLGLSLAGHKDRNCMAVFVCGLNPNGAAYKAGDIQVGDEILEVNGVVLHGRCHLNASAIIKGLAGPIFKIIILRRRAAVEDIAVRPLTHFPVSLYDEISEDKFSNYPNVRNVAIKKGSHSLGIMIIEGKHSELGQGIFISDIQDGSAAEKAGLEVGEMILAVNKNSLLGANYDTAANLLKRTEGVVTLILSNPAKKPTVTISNTENDHKTAPTLKASGPPSRATTPLPEPPVDPTTCSIVPGKNNTIEMMTDNRGLGLFLIGGKDTLISGGIVVVEVYSEGAADKDGRIKAGDQILDANGTCLKEVTNETALQTLRQILPKMKLVILRPEKIEYTTVEVDLTKKPGKGLGLSVMTRKSGKGVYISEVLNGGNADIDGRITKGDMLVSVNGQNTENLSIEEVGVLLKTVTGRTILKFHRYKPTVR